MPKWRGTEVLSMAAVEPGWLARIRTPPGGSGDHEWFLPIIGWAVVNSHLDSGLHEREIKPVVISDDGGMPQVLTDYIQEHQNPDEWMRYEVVRA